MYPHADEAGDEDSEKELRNDNARGSSETAQEEYLAWVEEEIRKSIRGG